MKNTGSIGEKPDIEQVYEMYFSKIYNYIFYRVLHKEIAEDIVSDIFMKVLLKLDSYDSSKASFNTWIFRIAEHTLIDYYRMRKIHYSLDDQQNLLSVDFEQQYEEITSDSCRELYLLLTKLSERQRMILYLKYFNNMSNRQIAELTGINASTVGTIHQRALETLRRIADCTILESLLV